MSQNEGRAVVRAQLVEETVEDGEQLAALAVRRERSAIRQAVHERDVARLLRSIAGDQAKRRLRTDARQSWPHSSSKGGWLLPDAEARRMDCGSRMRRPTLSQVPPSGAITATIEFGQAALVPPGGSPARLPPRFAAGFAGGGPSLVVGALAPLSSLVSSIDPQTGSRRFA